MMMKATLLDARTGRVFALHNCDIKRDSKGAVFVLRGKTGKRRVRIIAFVKLLQQWLDIHPLKHLSASNQIPFSRAMELQQIRLF